MKKYFLKNKVWLTISIIMIMLEAMSEILKAYLMQNIIDSVSYINNRRLMELLILSILYICYAIVVNISASFCNNKFIQKSMISIKNDLFNGILNKNIKDFNKHNSSEYISILSNDMNIIEADYFQNFILTLEYIVTFAFAFIAILNIHYYFIIFILLTAWIPLLINKIMSNTLTKRKIEFSDQMTLFMSKITDIFSGFEVIKTYNIQSKMRKAFIQSDCDLEEKRFKSKHTGNVCETLSFAGSLIIWLGSLLLGCFLVMKGRLTIGYVLGASQLLNCIVNPLYRLPVLINKMKASESLIEKRVGQAKESKYDIQTMHIEESPKKIIFDKVTLKINESEILHNVSFEFEKGKKYAIIGESGSGKSTILKLLMRYYDDDYEGSISIDNIELNTLYLEDWYGFVSSVQQNVYLFGDSIMNNISLYRSYDNDKIEEAIKKSYTEDFINALPEKIDTLVNENGKNFSGGECQRISIARTFIKDSPILLLDEATSALDNMTGYNIEKAVLDLEGVTAIVVTHKINAELMKLYDCVIVVKNGRIVDSGPFDKVYTSYAIE